jgi:antitoxin ParD1/3/4/toxin ParE1/3/4
MSRYALSVEAGRDLETIWEQMAREDRDAADHWMASVFDCFDLLSRSPGIGQPRRDLTAQPLLFWPVGDSLILYRSSDGKVEFIAVCGGPLDIPTLLAHGT